jgi:hypothetical protein
MFKRTLFVWLCVTCATAVSAQGASAAGPRIQVKEVGGIVNAAVPVKLRCVAAKGAVCELAFKAKLKKGESAAATIGIRRARLAANATRVVWVPAADGSSKMGCQDSSPGVPPAMCAIGSATVEVSGRVGKRKLAAVARKTSQPVRLLPGLVAEVVSVPRSRIVKLVYISSNGCPGSPSLGELDQNKNEVTVDFKWSPEASTDSACTAAFTPFCVSITLSGPLGGRSVWTLGSSTAPKSSPTNAASLSGFPGLASCQRVPFVVAN